MTADQTTDAAPPWSCQITGNLHILDDPARPVAGCYCFNCGMARINAEIDVEREAGHAG